MLISFVPQRRDDKLTLELTAPDRLRVNGELFNFGPIPEGGSVSSFDIPSDWFSGPVTRVDGEIHLQLFWPVGPITTGEVSFPDPMRVDDVGPVSLPEQEHDDVDA